MTACYVAYSNCHKHTSIHETRAKVIHCSKEEHGNSLHHLIANLIVFSMDLKSYFYFLKTDNFAKTILQRFSKRSDNWSVAVKAILSIMVVTYMQPTVYITMAY